MTLDSSVNFKHLHSFFNFSLRSFPIKKLSTISKSWKESGQLLLRDSNVSWSASEAVECAESRLEFKKKTWVNIRITELVLDLLKPRKFHQKHIAGCQKLVSLAAEKSENDKLHAKLVQLSLQEQWITWCDYIMLDLPYKNLLTMPKALLSFCLSATYDTLPSLSNFVEVAFCSRGHVLPSLETSWHISSHSPCMQGFITTSKIYFLSWCSIASPCINN